MIHRPRVTLTVPDFSGHDDGPPTLSIAGLVLAPIVTAGITTGITLMYLAMAFIMETEGGFVASGGPYEIAHPAPTWVGLVPLSIFAMFIFGGVGFVTAKRGWGENPVLYAWMGLFISLGWNFLRLGFSPPEGLQGAWAWIMCGVVFWIMGFAPAGPITVWAIAVLRHGISGTRQGTLIGRSTRAAYIVLQVLGAVAGIAGGTALFGAVTGV